MCLERVGAPSRWNTLRALRVLKWWDYSSASRFSSSSTTFRVAAIRSFGRRLSGPSGRRFDRAKFHDFVLAQGPLPPALLRRAVIDEWIANEKAM